MGPQVVGIRGVGTDRDPVMIPEARKRKTEQIPDTYGTHDRKKRRRKERTGGALVGQPTEVALTVSHCSPVWGTH